MVDGDTASKSWCNGKLRVDVWYIYLQNCALCGEKYGIYINVLTKKKT